MKKYWESFTRWARVLAFRFCINTAFEYNKFKQECIPVGCVPSTAVAVGGCLPKRVSAGRGVSVCQRGKEGVCQRGCLPRGVYTSLLWQTDTCKNITFPQLLLWTVINSSAHGGIWVSPPCHGIPPLNPPGPGAFLFSVSFSFQEKIGQISVQCRLAPAIFGVGALPQPSGKSRPTTGYSADQRFSRRAGAEMGGGGKNLFCGGSKISQRGASTYYLA